MLSTTLSRKQTVNIHIQRKYNISRLLEWILFKDPPNGLIPKSDELFTTLQEIQKPQECTSIARGCPHELRDVEWLIIGKQSYPLGVKRCLLYRLLNVQILTNY